MAWIVVNCSSLRTHLWRTRINPAQFPLKASMQTICSQWWFFDGSCSPSRDGLGHPGNKSTMGARDHVILGCPESGLPRTCTLDGLRDAHPYHSGVLEQVVISFSAPDHRCGNSTLRRPRARNAASKLEDCQISRKSNDNYTANHLYRLSQDKALLQVKREQL